MVCFSHLLQMLRLHTEGSAHLFRCAIRYFRVSLCDGGSRARDSRNASSFFSGSVSSERQREELLLEQSIRQGQQNEAPLRT